MKRCVFRLSSLAVLTVVFTGCSLIVDDTIQQAFGEPCEKNGHCKSGICSSQGFCTAACDAANRCPATYTCYGGLCIPSQNPTDVVQPDTHQETTDSDDQQEQTPLPSTLKAGFLYIGPVGDHGWTFAHEQGRQAAQEALSYLDSHYQESVAVADAPAAIESMIAGGDNVIVGTSYDFLSAVQNAAINHPTIRFLMCSGFVTGPNLGSYFGRMQQAEYLAGMVAGYMTKTNRVGYLGPVVIPETIRHLNSFVMGVRHANPQAQVRVEWVLAWFDPPKEEELTNALLEDGIDVVASATDTTIAVDTIEQIHNNDTEREIYSIGYDNENACQNAPMTCLTTPYWNWGPVYRRMFAAMKNGTWDPYENPWDQIKQDPSQSTIYLADINPLVPPAKSMPVLGELPNLARDDDSARAMPFVGPLNDVNGTTVLQQGDFLTDAELLRMCWFVEGLIDAENNPAVVPAGCGGDYQPPARSR